ncbi:MAG: glycosyltransferase family 1 protein [Pedobacter sp.]|nr:MAG: glycosyltransferase family 1 protein [Pedobacter sp.]
MKTTTSDLPKNLLCFSHLRWDFVFQRPQHLLSRFAKEVNVFFLEEPIFDAEVQESISVDKRTDNLTILRPRLKGGLDHEQVQSAIKGLLANFLSDEDLEDWVFWYYTPMALQFSDQYKPALVVFDCMDELSAFDFAPKDLVLMEKKLMQTADVVFTGGYSLYEAKKHQHNNIYAFPSSIDEAHFAAARSAGAEPDDQAQILGVKLGFFGVIDERFDVDLIDYIASKRPEWQLILLGPVVKISNESLPRRKNIHYLGKKTYDQLPAYLAGWDIALIPFKMNDSTRFISPTKTPEYLAAGVRVVSTPIRDVVKPYGIARLVGIAEEPDEFIAAVEYELNAEDRKEWLSDVDLFLKDKSWDHTFLDMKQQLLASLGHSKALIAS